MPCGELDIATAPQLEQAIAEATADAVAELVLDLRELTFMDSTGLRALAQANVKAEAAGTSLAIWRGPRQIERVLEISGLGTAAAARRRAGGLTDGRRGGDRRAAASARVGLELLLEDAEHRARRAVGVDEAGVEAAAAAARALVLDAEEVVRVDALHAAACDSGWRT